MIRNIRQEFELDAGGGYRFRIVAERLSEELGWSASVVMTCDGYGDAEGAVNHLAFSAKAFLRWMSENRWGE